MNTSVNQITGNLELTETGIREILGRFFYLIKN
jgi:hypothetical protein